MTYELEPLYIELTAPKGAYEVTLTINAESDCVFSVFEDNFGTVRDEFPIKQNTSEDVIFTTKSCGSIVIEKGKTSNGYAKNQLYYNTTFSGGVLFFYGNY